MSNINIFRERNPSSINYLQPLNNVINVSKFVEKLLIEESFRIDILKNVINDLKKLNLQNTQ